MGGSFVDPFCRTRVKAVRRGRGDFARIVGIEKTEKTFDEVFRENLDFNRTVQVSNLPRF